MTMHPFLMPSPYEADAGELIGRDPRTISEIEWSELAGEIAVGMKAIRLKCLDCCGNNSAEVRKCTSIHCPLWPLRMGRQPKGLRAARRAEETNEAEEGQAVRTPTPEHIAFEWHRACLAGENPPVHDSEPHCGWFKTKIIKGGPWVPARIFLESVIDPETGELECDEVMVCEVGIYRRDPVRSWLSIAHHPITKEEFDELAFRASALPQMADATQKVTLSEVAMRP